MAWVRVWGRAAVFVLCAAAGGCAATSYNSEAKYQNVRSSWPAPFKIGSTAAVRDPVLASSRLRTCLKQEGASWDRCVGSRVQDYTAIGLSGGGTKATVFGGEALFYLGALGWLQQADLISAVSGGSFAAALYALSCEPDDRPCQAETMSNGQLRPVWAHGRVMQTLGLGNGPLISEQLARVVTPGVPMVISAHRFGTVIERRFLGGTGDAPITLADLNWRRPQLALNATIVSENRGGLDDRPDEVRTGEGSEMRWLCPWNAPANRHFLRRRTPDELFHFAFTPWYFGVIGSRWGAYPLGDAVAASAAFPALIEPAILRDWCKQDEKYIRLIDGGANDNQALIEIYHEVARRMLGQHRGPLPDRDDRLVENGRAVILLINSSVVETTGQANDQPPSRPHELVGFVTDLFDRITAATDTYSAVGYNLRKQLYLHQIAGLGPAYRGRIRPIEISLTQLDQYANGGSEAAQRVKSGLDPAADDPAAAKLSDLASGYAASQSDLGLEAGGEQLERGLAADRRFYQRRAFNQLAKLPPGERRDRLLLPRWHPQCYFDIRAILDKSLSRVPEEDQACLRDGARWATVLRAQEQCERFRAAGTPLPAGLSCNPVTNVVELSEQGRRQLQLEDDRLAGASCNLRDRRYGLKPLTYTQYAALPRSDQLVTCSELPD